MISKNGKASSTKAITAATLPAFPLYILEIIYAETGAQIRSIKGIKPMASKTILKANF